MRSAATRGLATYASCAARSNTRSSWARGPSWTSRTSPRSCAASRPRGYRACRWPTRSGNACCGCSPSTRAARPPRQRSSGSAAPPSGVGSTPTTCAEGERARGAGEGNAGGGEDRFTVGRGPGSISNPRGVGGRVQSHPRRASARRRRCRALLRPHLRAQVRVDEHIDLPIEHRVCVPHLRPGAVVLHHPVGVQHVRPDLVPEADLLLPLRELGHLLVLPLPLELVEPRLQDLHRHRLVLVLRALVLAGL